MDQFACHKTEIPPDRRRRWARCCWPRAHSPPRSWSWSTPRSSPPIRRLPYAQAVAIEDGRILAVDSNERVRALIGPKTRIIDVGGRLVTPGLIEAHVHLGNELPTAPLAMPNLPFPGPTGEQALAAVEQASKTRTDWICAYVGPLVARDQRNWRKALDVVAPNTPVFLKGFWGHTSIVNSEGLRRLGITESIADPSGRLVGPGRKRSARRTGLRGRRNDHAAHTTANAGASGHSLRRGAAALCAMGRHVDPPDEQRQIA